MTEIHQLAVVVRAASGPKVTVAVHNPGEGRAFPTLSPADADRRLEEIIAKQVTVFELEQRIREALLARLPQEPPWSTALPAATVATALQSFLIVDRTVSIDYEALRAAGADAVLELRVAEWGVTHQGKTGLFLHGNGRLVTLPGEWGVWADVLDTDVVRDTDAEAVDVVALREGGFREAVIGLVGRLADRIAPELAGKR